MKDKAACIQKAHILSDGYWQSTGQELTVITSVINIQDDNY